MRKAEKFVNDFMQAFDENGLAAPDKIMYLRAYQELEKLQQLKGKNLFTADVIVPKGTLVCDCANNLEPLSASTGVCKICDTYVDLLAN